jgi:predicted dehydrogenase
MKRTVGIVMNGVTGRMGLNQHLVRSIVEMRSRGGLALPNGDTIWPEPVLVGRNAAKVEAIAREHGIERWTTDVRAAIESPECEIFFDAATTAMRPKLVQMAIDAGKHVYCEKPLAPTLDEALALARHARDRGVKNGIVHDKLYLPGLLKLRRLIDSGFFGRILSLRGEFGYWVFEGDWGLPAQRPSWNYRADEGGGIMVDMFCHWRYVLENLLGPVTSVSCMGATHIPERVDENGDAYRATADDAAYGMFEIAGGIVATINSSWCTRVYRDELVTFQIDGTLGSAVVGLRECKVQHRVNTPRPIWNPDVPNTIDFYDGWTDVPDNEVFENGFYAQWAQFLRHVVLDEPFPYDFMAGARGVQLAELGLRAWHERRWVDVPPLSLGERTLAPA